MRKIPRQDVLVDDEAPARDDAPSDDRVLNANGTNAHGAKPCPFCGATDVQAVAVQITPGVKADHAVRCKHCDCSGPWAISAKVATQLWNDGYQFARPAAYRRKQIQAAPKK